MKNHFLYLIFGILLSFNSCKKSNEIKPSGQIDFYLLESYNSNNFQIDESSIKLQNVPLINYSDIIWYDSTNHSFKITNDAKTKIKNLNHSTHGIAFAVLADNNLVYSGYFLPSYSSQSCNWIVIDPIEVDIYSEMKVKIGYPGLMQDVTIPDKRNDKQIINILARDNKLIK